MATRPPTMPESRPSKVGAPRLNHSISIQDSPPAAAATSVTTKASAARPSADRAEPALKPNQPKSSNAVPMAVQPRLLGSKASVP